MRALRLCHTTSQWRGTTAEQHGCCVSMTSVLLLLSQHIDRTAWAVNMLTEERVVRELLGGAPPCRRPSREAQGWRISWGSSIMHTSHKPGGGGGSGTPGDSRSRWPARGRPGVGAHSAWAVPGIDPHCPGWGSTHFHRRRFVFMH